MNGMTMRKTTLGAFAAVLVGLVAAPAFAQGGTAYTADAGDTAGRTVFDDGGDSYVVCDLDNDDEGVVGWIEVEQPDGSWNAFARVYVRSGNGTCAGNNVDIIRESARVKIVACRQNGPGGAPYACGQAIVPGD